MKYRQDSKLSFGICGWFELSCKRRQELILTSFLASCYSFLLSWRIQTRFQKLKWAKWVREKKEKSKQKWDGLERSNPLYSTEFVRQFFSDLSRSNSNAEVKIQILDKGGSPTGIVLSLSHQPPIGFPPPPLSSLLFFNSSFFSYICFSSVSFCCLSFFSCLFFSNRSFFAGKISVFFSALSLFSSVSRTTGTRNQ